MMPAVIVNSLEIGEKEGLFVGAIVIHAEGNLLAESPHGTDEVLYYYF